MLIELLSGGMEYTRVTPVTGRSTLVIDGQALVMALGRPTECNTFDDLADRFLKAVLVCDRIDVAFDRYRETSIKCATRKLESVPEATRPFEELLKMGQYPCLGRSVPFWLLIEAKQI